MIQPGDRILIGLSGGADSICLAELLWHLKEEFNMELGALYCHHGIRGGEADEDGFFVKRFCEAREIAYFEARENVEERAKKKKMSVEEAGREFRYETFEQIMVRENFGKLAVAHNANDRAETMLFHLARGTNLSGLCTMEPMREFGRGKVLIRPLLWTTREEIEKWLVIQELTWRTDSTNLSDLYTRNQIRHQVLPKLQKINAQAVQHMGEASDSIREAVEFLGEEEEKIIKSCVKVEKERAVICISMLQQCHIYMKKAVLYRVLCQVLGSRKDIGSIHIKMLLDLLDGESGKQVSLGHGLYGRKEYDKLVISDQSRHNLSFDEGKLSNIDLQMEVVPYTGQEILKNKYTKYLDCDKIKDNLVLRHWQEGDYIFLREDGGKKKLGRYFIDEKIPPEERRRIPLLADGNHIVWVVGYRISAYYKVTDKTKNILVVNINNKG